MSSSGIKARTRNRERNDKCFVGQNTGTYENHNQFVCQTTTSVLGPKLETFQCYGYQEHTDDQFRFFFPSVSSRSWVAKPGRQIFNIKKLRSLNNNISKSCNRWTIEKNIKIEYTTIASFEFVMVSRNIRNVSRIIKTVNSIRTDRVGTHVVVSSAIMTSLTTFIYLQSYSSRWKFR